MKKLLTSLLIITCGIVLSACAEGQKKPSSLLALPDRSPVQIRFTRQANPAELNVTTELVNSDASRTLGLSGRSEIGSEGMLFVFPQIARHGFWMKEMKMNLDIIWILDKKIIDITANVPAPTVEQQRIGHLPTYSPNAPVNLVLEVPAGSAKTWKLQPGDAFEIR